MTSNLEKALKFIERYPTAQAMRKRVLATVIASAIVFWSGVAIVILTFALSAPGPQPLLAPFGLFFLAVILMYLGFYGTIQVDDYRPLRDGLLQEALDLVAESNGARIIRDAVGASNRQVYLKDFKAMKVEGELEAQAEKELRAVALRKLVNQGTKSR